MKLQEKNNQFSVTIPQNLVKHKGWKKGQEIVIVYNENGDIVLKGVK